MEPAVKVVLTGVFQPVYSTGDFGDRWSSWLQIEREDRCSAGLKRPHSRRNPWQPECGQFSRI